MAFIAYGRMTPEQYAAGGYTGIVPDLVVEVVSENDLASAVEAKRIEWQRAGAREVWVVLPETSTVHAHRAGGPVTLGEGDTLTAPDVLPGFAVPVAELFRLPPAPAAA